MNFMEAIKAMKQGKKVIRSFWMDTHLDSMGRIKTSQGEYVLDIDDFEATDWEIYEEKKTLSDKIVHGTGVAVLNPQDVKQSLKEFIEWVSNYPIDSSNRHLIKPKAKEIFGGRLLN